MIKNFPTLDIKDYILREQEEDDLNDFFEYFSDPNVNKYILCNPVTCLEDARKELYYWRNLYYNNQGIYFAIADKKNNKMIGSIGINNINQHHQRAELSYDLASPYWQKGIMTKAINVVANYVFLNSDINRIEAFIAIDNIASKKLLAKCNFTFEGTLRHHRIHLGKKVDVYIYSYLRQDMATFKNN